CGRRLRCCSSKGCFCAETFTNCEMGETICLSYPRGRPIMQLDRYDRPILDLLQQDGRISYQDLADRITLSPSSCLRRLRAMQASGLVRGRRALPDATQLGLSLMALIHISMERHTPERSTHFEAQVAAIPECLECLLITGQD